MQSTLQKVNHDHELRYEELLHMFEEEKRKLSKETDNTKRKLMQGWEMENKIYLIIFFLRNPRPQSHRDGQNEK